MLFRSLTMQEGDGFEVGDDKRQMVTLEHVSAWSWGDLYAFYDEIKEKNTNITSYYYEISPRFSMQLYGLNVDSNFIKDILLATTLERGSSDAKAYLIGPGVTWNLPPQFHLETNIYFRNNPDLDGNTWQLTTAWAIPFNTGLNGFLFDGYIDVRGSEGNAKSEINFNPQIKVDLGQYAGYPGIIHAGIEYYYWNNKFGINGANERALSILLQAHHSF